MIGYSKSFNSIRDVTKLDGGQGKKQVWRSHVFNLRSFGSKCTQLQKVLVRLLKLFGAPCSDSAPGETSPFPLVTPLTAMRVLLVFERYNSIETSIYPVFSCLK